eukprot:m.873777 g.873777  ORF g.873777 m.873777 type:complete len:404 (-) comp23572_c1_seq60:2977-4188(-)
MGRRKRSVSMRLDHMSRARKQQPNRMLASSKHQNTKVSTWKMNKETCCHVGCKRSGVPSVNIPLDKAQALLKAAGRTPKFIKRIMDNKRCLRMCVVHFSGTVHSTRISAKDVLPFKDDPVMMGIESGRGIEGDKWFNAYEKKRTCRATKIRRTTNSTPQEAGLVEALADQERDAVIVRLREEMKSKNHTIAMLKRQIKQSVGGTEANDPLKKVPMAHSYEWYLNSGDEQSNFYTGMSVKDLKFYIECACAAQAETLYNKLLRGQSCALAYVDALCIGITRLFRHRHWKHFEFICRIPANTIRLNAKRAFLTTQSAMNATINRVQDKSVREYLRVPCLSGEFGKNHPKGQGPVEAILDGFSVRVNCALHVSHRYFRKHLASTFWSVASASSAMYILLHCHDFLT